MKVLGMFIEGARLSEETHDPWMLMTIMLMVGWDWKSSKISRLHHCPESRPESSMLNKTCPLVHFNSVVFEFRRGCSKANGPLSINPHLGRLALSATSRVACE